MLLLTMTSNDRIKKKKSLESVASVAYLFSQKLLYLITTLPFADPFSTCASASGICSNENLRASTLTFN